MSDMEDIGDSSSDMIEQQSNEQPPQIYNIQQQEQILDEKKQQEQQQVLQKDEQVAKPQSKIKKPNTEQRQTRKGRARSPDGKNENQPLEKKRQSSQPAVPVSKEVIDQLLQENQDKKTKESLQLGNKATERLFKYSEDLKSIKKNKADVIVQEQMKECTFKPQIISKNASQQRNFDEFLDSQTKYERTKKEKIQSKKEEILEKQLQMEEEFLQSKNYLCQGSAKILSKQTETKPFHERLYYGKQKAAINKQLDEKQNEDFNTLQPSIQEEQNQQFVPKINEKSKNLKRDGKIEDLLYAESKRREEKLKKLKQQGQKIEVKTSDSSKKVLRKKFISEYKEQLQQIEGLNRISYANLSRILLQLYLIKNEMNDQNYQKERELQRLIWNVLQGDERNGIHNRNLLKFILALNNLYEQKQSNHQDSTFMDQESITAQIEKQTLALNQHNLQSHEENTKNSKQESYVKQQSSKSSKKQPSESSDKQPSEDSNKQIDKNKNQQQFQENKDQQNQQGDQQSIKEEQKLELNEQSIIHHHKYGQYQEQEDIFVINEQQAFRIFCDFKLFYNNRHSVIMKNNVNPTYKSIPENTVEFKPQVDKNSQRMAQQLREKKGDSNIVEHLINQGKEKEQKLKEIKEKLEQEKSLTYTFKPNTSMSQKTKHTESQESEFSEPRYAKLFNMHKGLIQKAEEKQKQKKQEEDVLDKDCTFQPKLETVGYELEKSKSKKATEIKGFDQMINRIQAGRYDKERVESILERGKDISKVENTAQSNFQYVGKKSQQMLENKKKKNDQLNLEEGDQSNLTENDLKILQKKKELLEQKEQQKKIEELKKQEQQKKMEEVRKQKEEQKKILLEKRKEEEKAKKLQKQQMLEEAKKIKQDKIEEMKKAQQEKNEPTKSQKVLKNIKQGSQISEQEENKQSQVKKREIKSQQMQRSKNYLKPSIPKRENQKKPEEETLTQNQETLTQNQETLAQNQETLTQNQENLTENQETLTQNQENLTQKQETLTENQETLTQNQENLTQKQETLTQKQETLTQKQETLTQKQETLTQKQETLTQKQENQLELQLKENEQMLQTSQILQEASTVKMDQSTVEIIQGETIQQTESTQIITKTSQQKIKIKEEVKIQKKETKVETVKKTKGSKK